eukprot:SAG31_NODE_4204_length_3475_cov_2.244076_4_plen_119_part_00
MLESESGCDTNESEEAHLAGTDRLPETTIQIVPHRAVDKPALSAAESEGNDMLSSAAGPDDEADALKKQLLSLKVRALRDRARECGVPEHLVQKAIDCNDAKTALIYHILHAHEQGEK